MNIHSPSVQTFNAPRGQLSFDVMIAIIVLLVTVQLFITLTQDMKESQEIMGVRAQQKSIALGVERVLLSGMVFSNPKYGEVVLSHVSADSKSAFPFEVNYKIPEIVGSDGSLPGCTVYIGDPKNPMSVAETMPIIVVSNIGDAEIKTEQYIRIPKGYFRDFSDMSGNLKCGGILRLRQIEGN